MDHRDIEIVPSIFPVYSYLVMQNGKYAGAFQVITAKPSEGLKQNFGENPVRWPPKILQLWLKLKVKGL